MSRGAAMSVAGFLVSILFIFAWSKFAPENPPQLPHFPGRPEWVPETAVYQRINRHWINVTPAKDGDPRHFMCAFYGAYSAEDIDSAIFELEGGITPVDDVRDLLSFFDGEYFQLKDDRIMFIASD